MKGEMISSKERKEFEAFEKKNIEEETEIPSPEESYSLLSRIFLINYIVYTYKLYKKIQKRTKTTKAMQISFLEK